MFFLFVSVPLVRCESPACVQRCPAYLPTRWHRDKKSTLIAPASTLCVQVLLKKRSARCRRRCVHPHFTKGCTLPTYGEASRQRTARRAVRRGPRATRWPASAAGREVSRASRPVKTTVYDGRIIFFLRSGNERRPGLDSQVYADDDTIFSDYFTWGPGLDSQCMGYFPPNLIEPRRRTLLTSCAFPPRRSAPSVCYRRKRRARAADLI